MTNAGFKGLSRNFLVDELDVDSLIKYGQQAIQHVEGSNLYLFKNSFFSIGDSLQPHEEKVYTDLFADYCNFFDKHKIRSFNFGIKQVVNYKSSEVFEERRVELPDGQLNVNIIENFNLFDFQSQYYLIRNLHLPEFLVIVRWSTIAGQQFIQR